MSSNFALNTNHNRAWRKIRHDKSLKREEVRYENKQI